MTKQHFIALADTLKALQPDMGVPISISTPQAHAEKWGRQSQWAKTRDALADFCQAQNPRFDRARWLAYIAGECGPNGGQVKTEGGR